MCTRGSVVDSLSVVRTLREHGVKIFFEKENIDSLDSKCDMILSIHASLAEEESRSISTNIRWSVQKRFEKGQAIVPWNSIYGYKVEKTDPEKRVQIDEKAAETVREMYFDFMTGRSYQDISDGLKRRGIRAPKGGAVWSKATIKSILENEKYMGDALLQKIYKRDFLAERRVKNTGQAPQKYVENNHPAIIDRTTWNAVQAEIERRNNLRSIEETGKGRYTGRYAFSGKIICCECGAGFRRHLHVCGDKSEAVWTCKEHIKGKDKCAMPPIKEGYLEQVFLKTINGLISRRDEILATVAECAAEAVAETETSGVDNDYVKAIDRQIEALQAQIFDLNKKRGRREIDAETYNAQSREVMASLDALFEKREGLIEVQSAGSLGKICKGRIAEFLEQAQIQTVFDKDIFTSIVKTVNIKDRNNITFELRNGEIITATV